jgi:hypothetical protein
MKRTDDISFHDITDKDMEKNTAKMSRRFWNTYRKLPSETKRKYPTDGQGEMGRSNNYYAASASAEGYDEDTRRDR